MYSFFFSFLFSSIVLVVLFGVLLREEAVERAMARGWFFPSATYGC
jgi:hypothetical protein